MLFRSQPYPPQPYPQPYPQPPAQAPQAPPRAPAGSSASYAANLLFGESALPSWLRQPDAAHGGMDGQSTLHQAAPAVGPGGAGNYGGYGGNGPYPPQPPQPMTPESSTTSAFPSLDRIGGAGQGPVPQEGWASSALIDPRALPAWLGGQPGSDSLPLSGQQQTGGMSAQSLIDESALPAWLRAQSPAPAPAPAQFASPADAPWMGATPTGEQGPAWQTGAYRSGGGAPPPAPPATAGDVYPALGRPGALTAGEFIDETALPVWLKSQGALSQGGLAGGGWQPGPQAQQPAPVPRALPPYAPAYTPGNAIQDEPPVGMRFSASDLIDRQALPQWVHTQEGDPPQSYGSAAGWPPNEAQPIQPMQPVQSAAEPSLDGWNTVLQPPTDMPAASAMGSTVGDPQPSSYSAVVETPTGRSRAGGKKRRGRPLQENEIPPWLQGMAPEPAGRDAHLQDGSSREWRAPEWPTDNRMSAQAGWDSADYQEPFTNGYGEAYQDGTNAYQDAYPVDDTGQSPNEYADEYSDGYDGYEDDAWQEPAPPTERRGKKRFFGRR